jgi:hypothetical protein
MLVRCECDKRIELGKLILEFDHQIVEFEREIDKTKENICPTITLTNGEVIMDTNDFTYSFSFFYQDMN